MSSGQAGMPRTVASIHGASRHAGACDLCPKPDLLPIIFNGSKLPLGHDITAHLFPQEATC